MPFASPLLLPSSDPLPLPLFRPVRKRFGLRDRVVTMASSTVGATGWLRGRVKAVPSGDCLVITAMSNKSGVPPEKTVTLSSLIAPKLARKGGVDEPFAWDSREYLRKLCIGKVREYGQQKGDASPFLPELIRLEEQAKQEGLGRWSKNPGAAEASIRNLPPSAIGNPSNLDAMGLLAANKGRPMQGIVEQVRDGSTLRVYLLPEFQFVQVFLAGVQAPSAGRRAVTENVPEPEAPSEEANGVSPSEPRSSLTSAQRLAVSTATSNEVAPDPFGLEAKHFTEMRVRIVLEGVDKFSNLIGSVYYSDMESAKELALELVECGLAKYVEWSANMLEEDAKRKLKTTELHAKKTRLRIWTNYVPPATNSKAIHDQNFTGKVNVSMEYSRKVGMAEGSLPSSASADSRVMDFGSVMLVSSGSVDNDVTTTSTATADKQPVGINVAEMVVARGFGTVIRHRDFEERSSHYDALLAAEARAISARKGLHSSKDPPVMHITDLVTASAKKARDFFPFLQRSRKIPAIVEYVFSGHRFKLLIPKETCSIAFAFSGIRCPGREEPYSEEAIALMRRKILQRDVEIEVETVDKTGTFLGTLWESKKNVAVTLVEAGLAKLQASFSSDRVMDAGLLEQAEQAAKKKKLKIWENYVEGEAQDQTNGSSVENRQKEVLKVRVTEVLGGGQFYIQTVGDLKLSSVQRQLAALSIQEAPVIGTFNPKKGDIVLAQYSADNSWNRAMIVNAPRAAVSSASDTFEVFYVDYGNQEVVTYDHLRPLDPAVASTTGLAQLCRLAHIKVPSLEEDFGQEAAEYLSELTLGSSQEFVLTIEERDASGGKVKGQGTGTVLLVTLSGADSEHSVNAAMVKEGLARMEKRRRWDNRDRKAALDTLEKFQEEARSRRLNMWQYGDVESDDEDVGAPSRRGGPRQ
ncbi:hypothetical protein MLD38_008893 [Melastoma candidum]|uniref:Uncharacterized protein n=1 Tax=Melastoma candidum TaxID=119954 RepID=A0ACB9RVI7_9MYRT|nr:hypothetical protein MLD38_008893 [Melastoma candidum]